VWHGHSADRTTEIEVLEVFDQQVVRVHGRNEPACEGVGVSQLVTSEDGRHVAYPARRDGRWRLVVDGQPGRAWAGIGEVVMSADARHIAYAAEQDDGRWRVVSDGRAGPPFEAVHAGTLRYAPLQRAVLTYVASDGAGARLVVNGQPGPAFDGIGSVRFGPGRLAYVAREGAWARVVSGGRVGPRYDEIPELVVAAGHVAYVAIKHGRFVLVVDGAHVTEPQDELVALQVGRSGRVACVQREGEEERIWLDGRLHLAHERVDGSTMTFSADGHHFAYVARDAGRRTVVLDEVVGPAYLEIDGPAFDSAGYLTYIGRRAGGSVVHARTRALNYPQWAGHPVTGGRRFAYLLRHGQRTAVVSDRGSRVFDAVIADTLTFDPSGERWGVVAVDRDASLSLVFEGGESRPLDPDELSAMSVRDPRMRVPWEITDAVRGWVQRELER